MINKEAVRKQYNPIFEIEMETPVRQMWFVGSNQRDVMGMLYKDEQGWVLRYRFRHYAEPISNYWDNHDTIGKTAWDGQDTKNVFTMRPKAGTDSTEEELTKLALGFTTAMEGLATAMQAYDPRASLWTKRVSTGREVMEVLKTAPWAYTRTESATDAQEH